MTSLKGVHEFETYVENRKKIDEIIDVLEKKLNEIASLFKTSTPQVTNVCGICTTRNHY